MLPPPPPLASRAQSLAALGHARHQHNMRSGLVLAGMAVAELGAGFLLLGTTSDDVGIALGAMGVVHGVDAGFQLDASRRRRSAFLASLAVRQDRGPEAVAALIRQERLAAERQARGHALLTGLFIGVVGGGVGLVVSDDTSEGALGPGGAVAFGGAVGALHHWMRWRQAVRYSVDLDTLGLGVPTVLEPRR